MGSLTAALLGIIVGALLKGLIDVALEERRDRARQRAALRLLSTDLLHARSSLQASVNNQEWWPETWSFRSSTWSEYGELLAARLDTDDWAEIAWAFHSLQGVEGYVTALRAASPVPLIAFDDPSEAQYLEQAIERVRAARRVIARLLKAPDGSLP